MIHTLEGTRMRIQLTQGQVALVDDADYEELSRFKWCATWNPSTRSFYATRSVRMSDGKWTSEYMHRRILGLERGDRGQVDHANHNTLDNRSANIRIVTHQENQHNRQCRGYRWHKASQKYRAYIRADGVQKHLGLYSAPDEARVAYLVAKAAYHPTASEILVVK